MGFSWRWRSVFYSLLLRRHSWTTAVCLIVAYSPSEIVMAVDSRVTNVQMGRFRDDYCKRVRRHRLRSISGFDSVGLLRRVVSR